VSYGFQVNGGVWTVGVYQVNATQLKMSANKFLLGFSNAQHFYLLLGPSTYVVRVRYFPVSDNTLHYIIASCVSCHDAENQQLGANNLSTT